MSKKVLVAILALFTVVIGTWAWAQQGQPVPQGGMGHGESGMRGTPGQPSLGMGPGGMMMGGQGQQGGMGMGMGHGMMGQQRGMGPGGMMMGGSRFERPIISEILAAKDRVGLTPDQERKLKSLRVDFEKEAIRGSAEIQAAEVDLRELLAAETPDLGKVETQVKKIAALQGELRFARVKVLQEGRAVLTKEQQQKFEALTPQTGPGGQPGPGIGPGGTMRGGMMQHQPGLQGMRGMMRGGMGQGGQPGSGMMMGPGMMQGMMGGQQVASGSQQAPPGAANGSTRTDATGPVTVSATLLPPRGDRVLVELKLDTHSVDLNSYGLEAGITLRNDRGESAPAAVEAPAGSGHHRSATVAFPATLAAGGAKQLELVVRDLGGVKERVLRWNGPFAAR